MKTALALLVGATITLASWLTGHLLNVTVLMLLISATRPFNVEPAPVLGLAGWAFSGAVAGGLGGWVAGCIAPSRRPLVSPLAALLGALPLSVVPLLQEPVAPALVLAAPLLAAFGGYAGGWAAGRALRSAADAGLLAAAVKATAAGASAPPLTRLG